MRYSRYRTEANQPEPERRARGVDAPEKYHYHAFISYSHADEAWARWLHKTLETWRVPKHLVGRQTRVARVPARLTPIFRDREELPSSASLNQEVNLALAQSANLVVVCSPAAAQSRWVNQEVAAFKRLGRSDRILCLIVQGEPEDCFVPALREADGDRRHHGTDGSEPMAADLRPGQDGRKLAILKLVSGMLGLRLDELRMREHQRKIRRLTLVTAIAVVITAVTGSLAIIALMARHSAEKQQSQAEGLVGFMLNDLDRKMQGTTRLETLQAISDRAMAYYKSLPSRDVNDSVLSGRADALMKIGTVQLNQGRLAEALASFQAGQLVTSQLLSHAPDNPVRLLQQATSMNKLGLACWYMGKLDSALQNFTASATLLQTANQLKPGDVDIAPQLAAARNNIGHILERRGELAAAGQQYRSVLEIYESLHRRYPDNRTWHSELGWAYNNVGKLAWRRGQIASSIANYEIDLKNKQELAVQDPSDRDAQGELASSNAILANVLIHVGQVDAALAHIRKAVEIGQLQVNFDPGNATSRDLLALYRMQLGRSLRLSGNLQQARAQVDSAQALLATLTGKDSDNVVYRQHLTRISLEQARVELADGKPKVARKHVIKSVADARSLLRINADNDDVRLLLSEALLLEGRILITEGTPDLAHKEWDEARRIVQPMAGTSSDPNQLDAWASALLLQNDSVAPRAITRLERMGYRDPDFVQLVKAHSSDFPQQWYARSRSNSSKTVTGGNAHEQQED